MKEVTIQQYYQQGYQHTLKCYQQETDIIKKELKIKIQSALLKKHFLLKWKWIEALITAKMIPEQQQEIQAYRDQLETFLFMTKTLQETIPTSDEEFAHIYYIFSFMEAALSSLQIIFKYNKSIWQGKIPEQELNSSDLVCFQQQMQLFFCGMEQFSSMNQPQKKISFY